jgi:hypothetical protein
MDCHTAARFAMTLTDSLECRRELIKSDPERLSEMDCHTAARFAMTLTGSRKCHRERSEAISPPSGSAKK